MWKGLPLPPPFMQPQRLAAVFARTEEDPPSFAAQFTDGTVEDLMCFNCNNGRLSRIMIWLHADTKPVFPTLPCWLTVEVFPSIWKNDYASGICYDPGCISFSTCTVTYNPVEDGTRYTPTSTSTDATPATPAICTNTCV